jgi:hypothetical protein
MSDKKLVIEVANCNVKKLDLKVGRREGCDPPYPLLLHAQAVPLRLPSSIVTHHHCNED